MLIKIFILFVMLAILISLMSGLVFLVSDRGKTKRTVKALSLRIGLSLSLFLFILLAFYFKLIKPHGL